LAIPEGNMGVQEAIALSISRAASMGDFSPLVF